MSGQRAHIPLENIPASLMERPQWVTWRYLTRKGKLTKVPFNARTGGEADSTDPGTWSTFDEAYGAWQRNRRWDGIGYLFRQEK